MFVYFIDYLKRLRPTYLLTCAYDNIFLKFNITFIIYWFPTLCWYNSIVIFIYVVIFLFWIHIPLITQLYSCLTYFVSALFQAGGVRVSTIFIKVLWNTCRSLGMIIVMLIQCCSYCYFESARWLFWSTSQYIVIMPFTHNTVFNFSNMIC